MIIVSGCPRSGTSLMMDLMRTALGDERILGEKFPQENKINPEQQENESDAMYALRQYSWEKNKDEILKDLEESKDMNPNGFWEMLYTVQGIHYRLQDHKRLQKLIEEPKDKLSVCKIVSQGLAASDPRYIDKIVYMIRHPRAVAKSQERLKRPDWPKWTDDKGRKHDLSKEIKVHTPEMYIQVTAVAAQWLIANPDIPVHFVNFDNLIENPVDTLKGINDFLGEGDFKKASKQIEPKLRRSKWEDIQNPLWEDAEKIYELFTKQDFNGILEYMRNPKRKTHTEKRRYHCYRTGRVVAVQECRNCYKNPVVRDNFRKTAENNKVDWQNEPCVFECGMDPSRDEYVSIEDSIKNNNWEHIEEINNESNKSN